MDSPFFLYECFPQLPENANVLHALKLKSYILSINNSVCMSDPVNSNYIPGSSCLRNSTWDQRKLRPPQMCEGWVQCRDLARWEASLVCRRSQTKVEWYAWAAPTGLCPAATFDLQPARQSYGSSLFGSQPLRCVCPLQDRFRLPGRFH